MKLVNTFKEMEEKYKDLPFLNILASGAGIRVYYFRKFLGTKKIQGEYQMLYTTISGIIPCVSNSAKETANILNELLVKSGVSINLDLFYPTTFPKYKKTKIPKLVGEYELGDGGYKKILLSFLLLLI